MSGVVDASRPPEAGRSTARSETRRNSPSSSAVIPTDRSSLAAGGIISDGWFQREWRLAKNALDLPSMHFHDLRHTAGTIASQQVATMKEVMSRLGHSTTSAAIRYQKAAADRDQLIADRLDNWAEQLRTETNTTTGRATPAGFSRVLSEPDAPSTPPESQKALQTQGFQEYPQRDSNPCRHLESSIDIVRPVRRVPSLPSCQGRSSVWSVQHCGVTASGLPNGLPRAPPKGPPGDPAPGDVRSGARR